MCFSGLVGPAPVCVRWTCLMMDLRYMLSVYLNRTHSHLKSIKLCANMAIKNIMTSDLLLDPGTHWFSLKHTQSYMNKKIHSLTHTYSLPLSLPLPLTVSFQVCHFQSSVRLVWCCLKAQLPCPERCVFLCPRAAAGMGYMTISGKHQLTLHIIMRSNYLFINLN